MGMGKPAPFTLNTITVLPFPYNVHWVHKKINQIKMDMNMQEFIELCKKVSNENK